MTGGSPSLARRRLTVILTVLVNGSAISSHTRSSSSSVVTTRPCAPSSSSRTPSSLGLRARARPARMATRRAVSRDRSPWTSVGASAWVGRRARARMRATSSASSERLGQVVVGAHAEALDPVGDGAGCGEHQHSARAPVGDQGPADLVTVDAGQIAVQHDYVVARCGDVRERVVAVEGNIDGHTLAAQPGRDRQSPTSDGPPQAALSHQGTSSNPSWLQPGRPGWRARLRHRGARSVRPSVADGR